MALTSDLISQFVKVTKDKPKVKQETTVYGKVVERDGVKYVMLDGNEDSGLLTPMSTTVDAEVGERVTVRLKDHTATITGNISSPSARKATVEEIGNKITEVELLMADKVTTGQLDAEKARIDELVADNVLIKDTLVASEARIDEIEADNATINEKLTAHEASINSLETTKLSATDADLKYATIKKLEATDATVRDLQADYGDFKELTTGKLEANEASITELDTKKLSAEDAALQYAQVDFANIGEAAVEKFYAVSGIIQNLTLETGVVVKELVGVLISGDLIQANTIKAEKLVVRGEDGIYYKLNVDALGETTAASDEKYQNGLDGSVIIAKSVTAEKISVSDLVAFGATIGGFNITDSAIYSGVKSAADNTTSGIYLDKTGQIVFGDSNNFVKFYKDTDDIWKLEINANSITFGSNSVNSLDSYAINGYSLYFSNGKLYMEEDSTATGESNLILIDRSTLELYNLYASSGKLEMQLVSSGTGLDNVYFNDIANGSIYDIYVSSGSLYSVLYEDIGGKKTIETALEESKNELTENITESSNNVLNEAKNNTAEALKDYVDKDTYDTYVSETKSSLDVLSDSIDMNFEAVIGRINKTNGNIDSKWAELLTYIRFSSEGIEIGKSDNPIVMKLDNDDLAFYQNGEKVAYISNNKLEITEAKVNTSLQIGNYAFVPRNNGSLDFRKVNT